MNKYAWCVIVIASFFGAALGSGCQDDSDRGSCPSPESVGRIEGAVDLEESSLPISATVMASSVEDHGSHYFDQAEVDSTGVYGLDLPDGAYRLSVRLVLQVNDGGCCGEGDSQVYAYGWSSAGPRLLGEAPETLRVDSSAPAPLRADFHFSGLHARINLPVAFEHETVRIHLQLQDPPATSDGSYYANYGKAPVVGGQADFRIAGIYPGRYTAMISISHSGTVERFWMPATRREQEARIFEVDADQPGELTASFDQPPARLEGEILGSWQAMGLDPPSVTLFDQDSSIVATEESINPSGRFEFDLCVPGRVRACVGMEGVNRWIGGADFDSATEYELRPGETISHVRIVESGLFLEVHAPSSGNAGGILRLVDASDSTFVAEKWFSSDDRLQGFPNLEPGTYLLRIEPAWPLAADWLPQWFDGAAGPESAQRITIAESGQVVPLLLTLERGGSIAGGALRDSAGESYVVFVFVTPGDVRRQWGAVGPDTWTSGDRYNFVARGLPDGDWKVGIWACKYSDYEGRPRDIPPDTVWYPGTTDWDVASIIRINDHEDVRGVDIALPRAEPSQARPD
jgi:hypothetical protein